MRINKFNFILWINLYLKILEVIYCFHKWRWGKLSWNRKASWLGSFNIGYPNINGIYIISSTETIFWFHFWHHGSSMLRYRNQVGYWSLLCFAINLESSLITCFGLILTVCRHFFTVLNKQMQSLWWIAHVL